MRLVPTALAIACAALPALAQSRSGAQAKASPTPPPLPRALTADDLRALAPRAIGPAVMGGRVSDVALHPADPWTFYVGLATGGVMKTTNGGQSFAAVFEKEGTSSIGAIAVAPSKPDVVWVGTGEANDRNSSGWGDGVYRSTDGGQSWTRAGLPGSRTILRVQVDPRDADVAWVAAVGDLWVPSAERGCFKTTDAGRTWKAVLTAPAPYGDRVGCGDLQLDPQNPDVAYAALYARRRTPWSFNYGPDATEGKDLGGIFKTTDGGATWTKLTNGLPARTGRIGLSVHRKDPKVVYAVVQSDEGGQSGIDQVHSKRGGVFRSDDGGATWTRQSALNPRPFYFSKLRVDPEDPDRVYVLGFALHVSEDGGRTWREDRFEKVHPDLHALEIDPKDPRRLLLGTDGGAYLSHDRGESWGHLDRMAAGQFYRVNVDDSVPYRICGGLQDNLNWVGPSRTRTKDGIVNADWINIGGGDGFYCAFDPDEPQIVYAESQGGYMHRFDLRSGQSKDLRPEPTEGQPAFRFHWNSPLVASRHEKGVLYLAGNRVFRLEHRGEQWQPISPDLSNREADKITAVGSGAENYAVVYAFAESPLEKGLLWAGTDDGKLWVTLDGGANWSDLTKTLPAEARGQWINRVEPGHFDARVAYLVVDAHRAGNHAPLVWRTADLGKTWERIGLDLPKDVPVRVVREGLSNPDLLFAGTETGLFVSLGRGARFVRHPGVPTVPVDDLLIHSRERDLVVATHGRSLYVIDDVGGLEALTKEAIATGAQLFEPRPAEAFHLLPGFSDWNGVAHFRGENPEPGAALTFWLRDVAPQGVTLAISDAKGRAIAELKAPGVPGFGRVTWDLRIGKEHLTEYGGEGQKFVAPGEYTVKLTAGAHSAERKLKVTAAPGVETR